MGNRLVIVGAGQTAEQIFHIANDHGRYDSIVFAVDAKYLKQDTFCGIPVLELESVLNSSVTEQDSFFIAMSWNRLNQHRTNMFKRMSEWNVKLTNIIADNAAINSKAEIGKNVWISELANVGYSVKIGNNVFLRPCTSVIHNSIICDHCFIGGSSVIGGNTIIGEGSFIGMGAVIYHNVVVGEKCIIGAGSTVRHDLPDYSIVYAPQSFIEQAVEATVLDKLTVR